MEPENEWKAGDTVRLKSGGPRMTVQCVDVPDEGDEDALVMVTCVWFPRSEHFASHVETDKTYAAQPSEFDFEADTLMKADW